MLERANRSMECVGELLAWRQTAWGMTHKARFERRCPLDQYLGKEMLLRGEVVVQRAKRNVGLFSNVLDLDALVLVGFQQREARVDDALTARQLILGQHARRYRF